MHAFVTVGSTRFDTLVQRALSDSVIDVLRSKGYSKIVVQCGNSDFNTESYERCGDCWVRKGDEDIEVWRFKESLQEEYKQADLVISHAGSGTILDVLRMRKPLIVIPNETLLDNHQQELASALVNLGHLKASTVLGLPEAIRRLDPSSLIPFPPFVGSRFKEMLDDEMGFA
ncbi:glycosyl transferase [Abortiporus biennis]|nr:glycosyl transferase [Abortiporus biennis]